MAELMQYVRTAPFAQMLDICVRGVMGIATNTDDGEAASRDFRVEALFRSAATFTGPGSYPLDGHVARLPAGRRVRFDDVRVGSLIFGDRDYSEIGIWPDARLRCGSRPPGG